MGEESGERELMAWSQEMRAWFALTTADYRGVLDAAATGLAVAPRGAAAVQLHAQAAKAWSRIGDRRQAEAALGEGRALLEQLPYPENLGNHFTVDPAKWDFLSMDCYRILGGQETTGTENKLAAIYAGQILRTAVSSSTGLEPNPMRSAEALVTLGVVAARGGEPDQALDYGHQALTRNRLSLPSLSMVSRELAAIIAERYPGHPEATSYLDQLKQLRRTAPRLVNDRRGT